MVALLLRRKKSAVQTRPVHRAAGAKPDSASTDSGSFARLGPQVWNPLVCTTSFASTGEDGELTNMSGTNPPPWGPGYEGQTRTLHRSAYMQVHDGNTGWGYAPTARSLNPQYFPVSHGEARLSEHAYASVNDGIHKYPTSSIDDLSGPAAGSLMLPTPQAEGRDQAGGAYLYADGMAHGRQPPHSASPHYYSARQARQRAQGFQPVFYVPVEESGRGHGASTVSESGPVLAPPSSDVVVSGAMPRRAVPAIVSAGVNAGIQVSQHRSQRHPTQFSRPGAGSDKQESEM